MTNVPTDPTSIGAAIDQLDTVEILLLVGWLEALAEQARLLERPALINFTTQLCHVIADAQNRRNAR